MIEIIITAVISWTCGAVTRAAITAVCCWKGEDDD